MVARYIWDVEEQFKSGNFDWCLQLEEKKRTYD